jgi:hypothetical protein
MTFRDRRGFHRSDLHGKHPDPYHRAHHVCCVNEKTRF